MGLETAFAMGLLMLLAVAGSSFFVRIASTRDLEIRRREEAAHEAARLRRIDLLGSAPPAAARPAPAPFQRGARGFALAARPRPRLRYAALVVLVFTVAAWPTSSGQIARGKGAADVEPASVRQDGGSGARRDCAARFIAAGEPAVLPAAPPAPAERCARII